VDDEIQVLESLVVLLVSVPSLPTPDCTCKPAALRAREKPRSYNISLLVKCFVSLDRRSSHPPWTCWSEAEANLAGRSRGATHESDGLGAHGGRASRIEHTAARGRPGNGNSQRNRRSTDPRAALGDVGGEVGGGFMVLLSSLSEVEWCRLRSLPLWSN
jgi:hypothetical protein